MSRYAGHNVVIVARNFNPTIFSQLWLVKHGIFSEKEVEENFVLTPIAVNLNTSEFAFLAVPDRIQLSFPNDQVDFKSLINRTLVNIIIKLPHTPYQAIGFNFSWILHPKDAEDFEKISRQVFVSSGNPISKHFISKGSRFGAYMSTDVPMGRLRLEIKPTMGPSSAGSQECLHLAYNFTRDLKDEQKDLQIMDFFKQWDIAHSMALEITEEMGKGWSS